jgi:DNA-binding response OmpR family regulator
MGLNPQSRARFNLEQVRILLLESTPLGMEILVQILLGFGARNIRRAYTVESARDIVNSEVLDLAIVDSLGANGEGYEFISWLRRSAGKPNYSTPVLLTAGHTPTTSVAKARDCGAHFIMRKPLTPISVLERIVWIGREGRCFVECDSYSGPDRRFKNVGALGGRKGRRRDDLEPALPNVGAPSPGQDVMDDLTPQRRVML